VPVIATKVGAVPEMIIDGETGLLVEADNEHELAKAIETLIINDELRMHFSIKA
jgi:glycosyltransferase involved in cell wall biosynthesis